MYGILFNCVILLVGDRLLPLVGAILPRNLHRKVREPASLRGSVPVLDIRRDRHYSAGKQLLCGLAPLLVPALAVNADPYLTAALIRMVSVPIVPAARLERHVCYEMVCFGSVSGFR